MRLRRLQQPRAWTVSILLLSVSIAGKSQDFLRRADALAPEFALVAPDAGPPADPDDPKQPESTSPNHKQPDPSAGAQGIPVSQQQPARILGVMPNFRAVSAGAAVPPPTWKGAFKIATQNSFDYSAFIFVGFTSLIAEGSDSHPDLGHGIPGYWGYYWRGFVDKTDGNYLVLFALPQLLHEDERYYAMGKGNPGKRFVYAASRVLITRDFHGHDTFNASELLGRAMAQGISTTYYPSADRTVSALASRLGYAVMRDALTQVFREFWPDIATHVLHRHP